MEYSELQVTSNFSFLRGASHPEELVEQAHIYGYKKIAITDRNTLAGIVRAFAAAKDKEIEIIPACRLDLLDGPSLLAYPTQKDAYSRLSALLSKGNLRAEKGSCYLYKSDVFEHAEGIKFILIPPATLNSSFNFDISFDHDVKEYKHALGKELYIAASRYYMGDDHKKLFRISQLAEKYNVPIVATNDVHYHVPERRELQDILTCVREKCTIQNAGFLLHPNAERFLKPVEEIVRLFRQYPDAMLKSKEIADACTFSLSELKYVYPEEVTSEGRTPQEELEYLAWKGVEERYGSEVPDKIITSIKNEMTFISEMNYASYFLTVYDIVRFARENGILCQGRGSAANSTVCYCLGITSVDPTKFELLFERFISSARNEPPDIDVDFEHERREEVIQYIYNRYGRDRAAVVATVTQQHQKGAMRDVGKVMGLSVDTINRLCAAIWEFTDEWFEEARIIEQGLNPEDPLLRKVLQLTSQMMGFPRQLGQHTGGFVITQGKLTDLCPILNARMENRTNIEWNKDDIDTLGFLKIDVLGLGMLTCLRKAFDLAKKHYGLDLTLANIPQDDSKVYEMISRADTIGVFQIESRAQQTMLPRLKPECFYDLVIEVAIVRPGPIQGNMVHPYLRRRNKEENIEYPSEELEEILSRTLGVPLFQEQAMKIAIVAAGFTPAEADELRRSMATFKLKGLVTQFEKKLIDGMKAKGYTEEFAHRIFKQLEGFGSYGFPESHAASFALLVYVSSWIKCYYPDVFAGALLNSMPMGFYQPAQIVIDAKNHGVEVLPVDVNFSFWDNILEENLTNKGSAVLTKESEIPNKEDLKEKSGMVEKLYFINESDFKNKVSLEEKLGIADKLGFTKKNNWGNKGGLDEKSGTADNLGLIKKPYLENKGGLDEKSDYQEKLDMKIHLGYEDKLGEVGKLSDCGKLCSGENLVCEKNLGFGKDKNEDDKPGNFHKLRLGFRQIKGIREEEMILLIRGRVTAYSNIADIRKSGVSQATLEKLADADAFRSLGFDRRQALWEVSAIVDNPEGLFEGQIDALASAIEGQISLPLMSKEEHVVQDYASTALSLKAHPLSFVREKLRILHILSSHELNEVKDGSLVKVAGLVLVRQRPGTAGGVCFITIEDETGFSNLVVFQNLFEKYRKQILGSKLLMVEGKIQREGAVTHVIVKHCFDLTKLLSGCISYQKEKLPVLTLSRGDEKSPFLVTNKRPQIRQNAQQEVFPKARNFK